VSHVAYKLLLPRKMTIHKVFHVSLLKPYTEDLIHPTPLPPEPVIVDGHEEYCVEEILDHRWTTRHGQRQRELLVRWRDYGPNEDSWEPLRELDHSEAYDRYEQEMLRRHGPTGWPPVHPERKVRIRRGIRVRRK